LGEKLRALLLAEPMHLETEALLMFAARREHVAQVIEPALARGEWVICDRFVDASFAYQGGGRGLSWTKLEQLADWVLGDLQPDLTLIFDAPVAVAQQRLHAATANPDRFEQEQSAFFERVRSAYLRLANENPDRVKLIDATQTLSSINKELEVILATV
jgi:dTMP kinase